MGRTGARYLGVFQRTRTSLSAAVDLNPESLKIQNDTKAQHDVAKAQHDVAKAQHDVAKAQHDVAKAQHDVAITKREVAITKREVAITKRDVAITKRDVAIKSMIWKFSGPYRAVKRLGFQRTR